MFLHQGAYQPVQTSSAKQTTGAKSLLSKSTYCAAPDEATSEVDSSFLGTFTSRRFGTSQGRTQLLETSINYISLEIGRGLTYVRALVSMGAVDAIAPTVFESAGAITNVFWRILYKLLVIW